MIPQHSLPGGRYPLPEPDFHRLDRASFAWRTQTDSEIAAYTIGPRKDWHDHLGQWANASEVRDSGIVLVRPDHHVCWRRETIAADPAGELRQVLSSILDR